MSFSSFEFIFIFLPLVLIIYFGMSRFVTRTVQHIFLIVASLVFYGYADPRYIILILSSIAINYISARGIESIDQKHLRKTIFTLAILFNVLLLGYYKYYNFFVHNINDILNTNIGTLKLLILPLGISFFTFQQIAFLISIWKKEDKVPNLTDYTLFITFYPQIVAGPIVFWKDVATQYQNEKNRFFDTDNFNRGLYIFAIGLFKKVMIADSLSLFTTNGFINELGYLSFGGAWITSLAFTMRIFFDFSGYSDMAIGLAKMMNINLPVNFYSPYKSKSITEFWKRWHITLGRSLAVLIYYPLGGNRKGLARTCFNLFMVFLVSGIWHGAAWTFVIWGIAHGVVRVFEKLFDKYLDKIPSFIRVFFTFMFVNAAWVLFNSYTLDRALLILKQMFWPDKISFEGINNLANDMVLRYTSEVQTVYVLLFMAVTMSITFIYKKNSIDLYNQFRATKTNAFITALLLSITVFNLSRAVTFIYFNF